MRDILNQLERGVADAIRRRYEIEPPESLAASEPPEAALGDAAFSVCFELARALRKAPKIIAGELAEEIAGLPGVTRAEVAGAGYLNVFLDRKALLTGLLAGPPPPEAANEGKVIVEHTNINPNKAAHIGHLRNAVLGDTLVRVLRATGRRVEVQNYIDDTGVQVADLVVAFQDLDVGAPEDAARENERFDYFCWDLYARITALYEAEPERRERRREVLHAMEEGGNDTAALAADLADRIVRCHLATMERLGVHYELLPRESDILHLRFWERAFEMLTESGAVHRVEEGRNAGCWVMDLSGDEAFTDIEDTQKVLVRSNGTVTYTGKDIAYQLWKFGRLGRDFHYRRYHTHPDGGVLWRTASDGGEPDAPSFGAGSTVYNVIDSRQAYPQKVVAKALASLGLDDEARSSIHFAYEMVALTPGCAAEMGMELDEEDRQRPYVEMSGRRGLGVKADDLVDRLIERSREEIRRRNPDMDSDTLERTARMLAIGALRYFVLRFTRNRVIAFDFGEVLSFEGETGPYVQYSMVRAGNILRKLRERDGVGNDDIARLAEEGLGAADEEPPADEWDLARLCARLDRVVEESVGKHELSGIARYAFALAQGFNTFYHRFPVLAEDDPGARRRRLLLVELFRRTMGRALALMAIEVPERM